MAKQVTRLTIDGLISRSSLVDCKVIARLPSEKDYFFANLRQENASQESIKGKPVSCQRARLKVLADYHYRHHSQVILANLPFSSSLAIGCSQIRLLFNESNKSHAVDEFEYAISEKNLTQAFQVLQQIDLNRSARTRKDRADKAKNLHMELDDIPDRIAKPSNDLQLSKSAILLPICRDENNKPSVLVTLRPSTMNTHRWEVCFPGGKQNDKDSGDIVETALRETEEEIGIPRKILKIYGPLKPLHRVSPKQTSVYPVVAYIDLDHLRTDCLKNFNSKEVEGIYLIPLERLCKKSNWHYTRWKSGWITPVYIDEVFNDKYVPRIWGLTAGFLFMFVKTLLPARFEGILP